MLGVNRLFVADAEEGGFDGFLLAPVDRTAMLVAKALALLRVPGRRSSSSRCRAFALLLLGPSLGRRCLGLSCRARARPTSASRWSARWSRRSAVQTRARDLLVPLLALPLLVPVVIGAARATRAAARAAGAGALAGALAG